MPIAKNEGSGITSEEVDAQIDAKINVNPVALGQSVNVPKNTPFNITLEAFDADDNVTGYAYGNPANGIVTGTPPNITYTPNANYVGSDAISFTATDANGNESGVGAINVNVYDVSDAAVGEIEVGTIVASAFGGPGDYPAADEDEYLRVVSPGVITHNGTSYNFRIGDRLRCTTDGTAVDTPANWEYIPMSPLPYEHSFIVSDWQDAATLYPSYPSAYTTGKIALPLVTAATHGKGLRPDVRAPWADDGTQITQATNWFPYDANNGDIALFADAGSAFAGSFKIQG